MATFVLVHGAWCGGWCWREVAADLRQRGHHVLSPTLTGLGERSHIGWPEVDVTLHAQDLDQVLQFEDLRDVVLVGHSYAGMVIRGVQAVDRIGQLIFLDAFVPEDAQALFDLVDWAATARVATQQVGEGWRVPPPPPARLGVSDPTLSAWVEPRLVPTPIGAFARPVRLATSTARLRHTYIRCAANIDTNIARQAERARGYGWRYQEIGSAHMVMLTEPRLLADQLDAATRSI